MSKVKETKSDKVAKSAKPIRKLKVKTSKKSKAQKVHKESNFPKNRKPLPIEQRKKIKKYVKQRCAFIRDNGTQCKSSATGKGTLCKWHGGGEVIKENLIKESEMALIARNIVFDPAKHPIEYIEMARNGMSDVEIAAEFEVAVTTIRLWSEKYEPFFTAYEVGKECMKLGG